MAGNNTSGLFREKSIERVSSPEQLEDYIRVTHGGAWAILAAMLILLTGIIVWGIFGTVSYTDEAGILRQASPISFILN